MKYMVDGILEQTASLPTLSNVSASPESNQNPTSQYEEGKEATILRAWHDQYAIGTENRFPILFGDEGRVTQSPESWLELEAYVGQFGEFAPQKFPDATGRALPIENLKELIRQASLTYRSPYTSENDKTHFPQSLDVIPELNNFPPALKYLARRIIARKLQRAQELREQASQSGHDTHSITAQIVRAGNIADAPDLDLLIDVLARDSELAYSHVDSHGKDQAKSGPEVAVVVRAVILGRSEKGDPVRFQDMPDGDVKNRLQELAPWVSS